MITEFYTTRKIGETRHLQPYLTPTNLFKLFKAHNCYFRNINPSTIPRRIFYLLQGYTKECRRITTMTPMTKHHIITISPIGSTNVKSLQTNTTKIIPATLTSIAPRIGTSPIVSMSTMIALTIIGSQSATIAGTTTILGLSTEVNRSTSVKRLPRTLGINPTPTISSDFVSTNDLFVPKASMYSNTVTKSTNKCLPQV